MLADEPCVVSINPSIVRAAATAALRLSSWSRSWANRRRLPAPTLARNTCLVQHELVFNHAVERWFQLVAGRLSAIGFLCLPDVGKEYRRQFVINHRCV